MVLQMKLLQQIDENGEVVGEHVEGYMEENETNSFLSELGF